MHSLLSFLVSVYLHECALATLSMFVVGYGLRSILLTSLGGMGMGLAAQAGYNVLMKWWRKKAIQRYCQEMGEGVSTSRFENWTFVS